MKHLIVITQKVDSNEDLLGFFVSWLREMAHQVERVSVITLKAGNYDLPSNVTVYSLGREYGTSKLTQFFRFYYYLFKVIPASNGIFAHMAPVFVIATWPVAMLFRKRIIFWYLHRAVTLRLRIAEKLCYRIVKALKESLSIASKKIIETGHGIDIEAFSSQRSWNTPERWEIISVGRISPIKNLETLIRAATQLREIMPLHIRIIGQIGRKEEESYLMSLKNLVRTLNIEDLIEFTGVMPYNKLPDIYRQAHITVNLTPRGGLDKVVLESMAAGCLTLTSNPAFKSDFGQYADQLLFSHGDVADLVSKIQHLVALDNNAKEAISEALRQNAKRHNIPQVIKRILNLFP